ncbi:MAG: exodeoxyribonuclease VII large subunit [bacterium]
MFGDSRDTAYSVSEITNIVKEILEQNLKTIWIHGEISNYSCPASGHVYFTLKDENNQIKTAFFGGRRKADDMDLKDGTKVAVLGRVSIYGKRSEYQIIADEIQVVGVGNLLIEFEKLKKRLSIEGLFDASRKLPIPKFPQKIGIITSRTGAAIRDILNILSRRYPSVDILIYPVTVQGDSAPPQIINALQEMDSLNLDVLILTRGGGSMEDLWAFNDEKLAYAIAEVETPIISAIGHEIDFTISDLVSDMRAPTPSAAAELVVPDRQELLDALQAIENKVKTAITYMIDSYEERLDSFAGRYAFKIPFNIFNDHVQRIDELSVSIGKLLDEKITESSDNLKIINDRLKIMNPLNILKKGYSVVYDSANGSIIKDSATAGKSVKIKLYKGSLEADITKKI